MPFFFSVQLVLHMQGEGVILHPHIYSRSMTARSEFSYIGVLKYPEWPYLWEGSRLQALHFFASFSTLVLEDLFFSFLFFHGSYSNFPPVLSVHIE